MKSDCKTTYACSKQTRRENKIPEKRNTHKRSGKEIEKKDKEKYEGMANRELMAQMCVSNRGKCQKS